MSLKSKWLFILIGNNNTGKTTLQKEIIKLVTTENCDKRLYCDESFQISHPHFTRKISRISFSNRSYQEKKGEYGSVEKYFTEQFKPEDICIISSHLVISDVQEMVKQGKRIFYNICGVFFSNSISINSTLNSEIAEIDWDEKLFVDNKVTEIKEQQDQQIKIIAESFVQMLIQRISQW